MDAGLGAENQVTRKSKRTERLLRESQANGGTDAAVEASLERARRDQRNWAAGAEGERMVAPSLEVLDRYGWTFLHDVHWPGRPLANLDHVAIGPGGVVVIDAKNWTGDIRVVEGTLRQNGYRRDAELEGVARATAAVTALLAPSHRSAAIGLLCLAGQDQEVASTVIGVKVLGRNQLSEFLVGLPVRLTPFDVADIARILTRETAGARGASQSTTASMSLNAPGKRRTPRPARTVRPRVARVVNRRQPRRAPSRPAPIRLSSVLRLVTITVVLLFLITHIPSIGAAIGTGLTQILTPDQTVQTIVPAPSAPAAPLPDPASAG